MTYKPGDGLHVFVSGDWRDATVLAVDPDDETRFLVEYEVGWTSALREIRHDGYKNYSYYALPLRWLRLIVEAGQGWVCESRNHTKRQYSPQEMLELREHDRMARAGAREARMPQ